MSETDSHLEKEPQEPSSLSGIHLGKTEFLPENLRASLEERQGILELFAEEPRNGDIWNYVADKTVEEEAEGTGQPEGLKDISSHDLIEFARSVLEADPGDRYALTTDQAPNGELWFDALYGFHGPSGNIAIANAATKQLYDLGQDKVDVAVDLGTGTGETAEMVAPEAERTVGLDRDTELLRVAHKRHPDIRFIEGDVTRLPFDDGSADIITSNGIKYTLDTESSQKMYTEVTRVLKDGGVYIDADWVSAEEITLSVNPFGGVEKPDFHPEELLSFVTWRAVLQDMIVDTVSGRSEKFEKSDPMPLSGHSWEAFKLRLGLYEETYQLRGKFSSELARARLLYKDPAKAKAQDDRYSAMLRRMVD